MLSVPPRCGAPLPALTPCSPLVPETGPPGPPGAALFEPPQAAAVIASTATPATAREPRERIRIDALSSLFAEAGRHSPPDYASVIATRPDGHRERLEGAPEEAGRIFRTFVRAGADAGRAR